jgi:hypothetical protein
MREHRSDGFDRRYSRNRGGAAIPGLTRNTPVANGISDAIGGYRPGLTCGWGSRSAREARTQHHENRCGSVPTAPLGHHLHMLSKHSADGHEAEGCLDELSNLFRTRRAAVCLALRTRASRGPPHRSPQSALAPGCTDFRACERTDGYGFVGTTGDDELPLPNRGTTAPWPCTPRDS